mgnify:FL=1
MHEACYHGGAGWEKYGLYMYAFEMICKQASDNGD